VRVNGAQPVAHIELQQQALYPGRAAAAEGSDARRNARGRAHVPQLQRSRRNERGDESLAEDAPAGDDFLAKLCVDWEAAARSLEPLGVRVAMLRTGVVLGAGGAARAIAMTVALHGQPAEMEILGVVAPELGRLGEDISRYAPAPVRTHLLDDAAVAAAVERAEILLQCTPVGMLPETERTLVPSKFLRSGLIVFDAVYNPRRTRLLREAASSGCLVIEGMEMFLGQAMVQFELWTGKQAPMEAMRRVDESGHLRAALPAYARVAFLGGGPDDDVEAMVLGQLGPGQRPQVHVPADEVEHQPVRRLAAGGVADEGGLLRLELRPARGRGRVEETYFMGVKIQLDTIVLQDVHAENPHDGTTCLG